MGKFAYSFKSKLLIKLKSELKSILLKASIKATNSLKAEVGHEAWFSSYCRVFDQTRRGISTSYLRIYSVIIHDR